MTEEAFRLIKTIRCIDDEYRDYCMGLGKEMKPETSLSSRQNEMSESMSIYPGGMPHIVVKRMLTEGVDTFGEICERLTEVKIDAVGIKGFPTCNIRKAMKKMLARGDLSTVEIYQIDVYAKQGTFSFLRKKNSELEINTPRGGIRYCFVPVSALKQDGLIQ